MPVHYCITILGIRVPLCGTVMEPQHPLECDKQQERHEYLFLLNLIMLINSNNSNAANNSNGKRTAQPSEMGKYSTPELQAAFDAGRALGRTEGMLSYQRHIMNQLFAENQKLNQKLQEQKGGSL